MSKFKQGDKVVANKLSVCNGSARNINKGDVEVVAGVGSYPTIWFQSTGSGCGNYDLNDFDLVTDKINVMSKQLTGYKLKKAIPGDSRTVGTVVPMTTEEGYYSLMPDFWEAQYKEEEIEIASYKAEIGAGRVKFGCQTFTKGEIEAIARLWTVDSTINFSIGHTPITRELVNKILSKI